MNIPFNKPALCGREITYIRQAVRNNHLSGDGFYTEKCSSRLENYLNLPKVLLTPSGTHALELAYLTLDLKAGDEVILPSYTFPSTANAFVLRGAKPRFVDIRPDTLNMDESRIEEALTKKTRVISPVHYAGVPCEMAPIMRMARSFGLSVVEDAAQALGARYHGQPAGSFGELNAFSFHETKNISSGEGGALAIRDRRFINRAEIIRQKGTNRTAFFRGEVDKYSWRDVGSSYVPSELQTAYLFGQLENFNKIWERRKKLFSYYSRNLLPFEKKGWIRLPVIPPHCQSSHHLFHVIFENQATRNRVLDKMNRKGINAVTHYFPLHLSKMGQSYGYRKGDFPVSERTSERLIRLPFFNTLKHQEQDQVLKALTQSI